MSGLGVGRDEPMTDQGDEMHETKSTPFKPGDRVYVIDPGLAQLRDIMRRATGAEPAPNHHGTIPDEPWDDPETVLIYFDDGTGAPYPVGDVRHLPELSS